MKKEAETGSVFSVDSFAHGLAFGKHTEDGELDRRSTYALRINEQGELINLRSRYLFDREGQFLNLESNLQRLSRQGILANSTVYFGVCTDPFMPFDGKFDTSMRFLQLFERFTPGRLIVQTRSPLVVIAMPVFKKLGDRLNVTIGLETCDEKSAKRYTPELPGVAERLKLSSALRHFGIVVNMQVSPILPYGDWRKDSAAFAEILCKHADNIFIKSLVDGTVQSERRVKNSALGQKLALDHKYHWLRPDSASQLLNAVEHIAPEKLIEPKKPKVKAKQLEIFAA